MPLQRVWMPCPNYSSRSATVRLIVLHTTEGARTYQDLSSWFNQSASTGNPVSSHVGIDDTPNTVGEYVHRDKKAWTQGNANSYAVAAEQCAFAAWSRSEWMNHPNMLENAAAWVAEEAAAFGIPLVRLTATQAQDGYSKGVCQHIDLGPAGGGHVDCDYGTGNYPLDEVIEMAQGGTPDQPTTEEDMIIKEPDGRHYWAIYGGSGTYWREVPAAAAARIPTSMIIEDDGSLKSLWKTGEKG